jgi:hypothetical protein
MPDLKADFRWKERKQVKLGIPHQDQFSLSDGGSKLMWGPGEWLLTGDNVGSVGYLIRR